MAFTDFAEHDWTTGDTITAALLDDLEKRAAGARATCQVYRANNTSAFTTGGTVVDWEAAYWDNTSAAMFDVSTPGYVTIQQAGIYVMEATLAGLGSSASNAFEVTIELNNSGGAFGGGQVLGAATHQRTLGTPTAFFHQCRAVADLSATDKIYVLVAAQTSSTIDANVYGDAGDGCNFTVTMLARNPAAT
mgnify:FL=1